MNSNASETISALDRHLSLDRLSFFVDGTPVSAPRQTNRDRFAPTGHVVRYNAWKDLIRLAARQAVLGQQLTTWEKPWRGPVGLACTFGLPIPQSWPKWKRLLAENQSLFHCAKPDIDNLVKSVKDALNGELWVDDAQVCRYFVPVYKHYTTRPQTWIVVYFLAGPSSTLTRNPGGEQLLSNPVSRRP